MADLMWSGGAQQLADYYPWIWNMMSPPNGWMCEPFFPTTPARSPDAFNASVEMISNTPYVGAFYGYWIDRYCVYYAAQWQANPPGTSTTTPVIPTIPATQGSSTFDPYSNYNIHSHLEAYFPVISSSLGSDAGGDTVHDKLDAIIAAIGGLPPATTGYATTRDVARLLAAIYYVAAQPIAITMQGVTPEELAAAVSDITDYVSTDSNGQNLALQNHFDPLLSAIHTHAEAGDSQATAVNAKVGTYATGTIEGDLDDLATAVDNIEVTGPGGNPGAPVWPGLPAVTLGTQVSLVDQLTITDEMEGVLVNVTTPPQKLGCYLIGGAYYDYRVGEIAFEADNGYIEPWQYLGFRQAIYTPKTMRTASKVRFRVLGAAGGNVTPWITTPV